MAILIPRNREFWDRYPDNPEIDYNKSINDDLKSFYIFDTNLYGRNIATGEDSQITDVGTGVNFLADGSGIETKNNTLNYIHMPHGISPGVGISGFGEHHLVSGGVQWSILRTNTGTWYGVYADGTALKTTNANSFDGAITIMPSGMESAAWSFDTDDLRGVNTEGLLVDSSLTEFGFAQSQVYLGVARRSSADNPSQSRFRRLGFYDRILSDDEKTELVRAPYQGLKPRRKYWVLPAAAAEEDLTPGSFSFTAQGIDYGIGHRANLTLQDFGFVEAGIGVQADYSLESTLESFSFLTRDLDYQAKTQVDTTQADFQLTTGSVDYVADYTMELSTQDFQVTANSTQVEATYLAILTSGLFKYTANNLVVESAPGVELSTPSFSFMALPFQLDSAGGVLPRVSWIRSVIKAPVETTTWRVQ